MNKWIGITVLACGLAACSQNTSDGNIKPVALDTEQTKFSYALGMDVGRTLAGIGKDLDRDAFIEAFNTTLDHGDVRLTAEEAGKVLQAMAKKKQEEMLATRNAQGEKNKKTGEAFLAANKQRDGIKTTESGLQYEVIDLSDGAKPTSEDTVKVHYRGTLIDGTEFDSSYSRKEPASFPLKNVIPGWTEGVQLMNVGSKYRFFVPSDLAYGENGPGPIGSNSTLIFEVELLEIVK
ncbi:MAG: FKBP-type peptidyl-prolyl cis-trans isomerase [Mariprofundaceae bacterium]